MAAVRHPLVAAPAAGVDPARFRAALGRFATGVALVTADAAGTPVGLVVSSLASVSLRPPLISICPSRDSLTWSRMRRAGRFGVNVLGEGHAAYVRAAAPAGADRFSGLAWAPTPGGVPRLEDAIAFLECAIDAEHRAGDHWIVLGRVERAETAPGFPLLTWASDLARLLPTPTSPGDPR
jgi:3-hydroxy-9,10-secoandrosta-1,3,5(10)-triene-9,17-dione monooxygenase reductase component